MLVNLDEGVKAVDIDLISRDDAKSFSFIIENLDPKADFKMVDFNTLYSSEEIINFCGQKLFVGQISRDIGVNFTLKSPTIQPMSSTRTWMSRAAISSVSGLFAGAGQTRIRQGCRGCHQGCAPDGSRGRSLLQRRAAGRAILRAPALHP